jgi:hypothetical protein
MKVSYAAAPLLALFSAFTTANPLRVTVIVDEPDAAPALAGTHPIEWTDCGSNTDVFQLKNITITPNPPVP